ncbi:restriction endonuclease subunit S [Variovorax boronicumulans]|uniref:restriction endonuclease subunit S n=1 Tax=Variovorax boronicumulans TaxID=436515 RepID=UPI0009EE2C12|nr:restriction endonuclease subunit S [Variovorax boronicumulans]
MSKWPLVAISDVADIERDSIQASEIKTGTLYVGLENIVSGGNFLDVREVDHGELASSKFRFTSSHLLYGKLRPYLAKIARPTFSGVCSTDILPVLPGAKLSRDYLSHYLRQKELVDLANARASGANLPRLSPKALASFEIPLPPLTEQRRIAAILDQAEILRTQRRAVISQLDNLEQAVFEDMFGEPEANPKQWPRLALAELAIEGFQNGLYKHASEYGGGTPILRIDAFYDGVVTRLIELKRVRLTAAEITTFGLHANDIVINRVNSIEYLGKSALIPSLSEPVVFESNMMRFTVNQKIALPVYITAFLQSGYIRRQIGTAAKQAVNQASINQRDVSAFQINVPPLSEQRVFARAIQSVQQLKAIHRTALARLDELFASLQYRAFRGELALTSFGRPSGLDALHVLDAVVGLEALIYVAKRMPAGRHHHYKSLKALYFADKRHLEQHGRLIYGETHSALPHGPVPQAAYDATRVLNGERLISDFDDEALRAGLRRAKDDQQDKLVALRDADFIKLGQAERESLEWAIRYCADMSFEQVKAASHDEAYDRTQPNKPIPVAYLVDMLPAEARERHRVS